MFLEMIEETGSSACASNSSSSASCRRPRGARQETAYQWWAGAYLRLRLIARWNSRSAPAQSQSWVDLTCANEAWASADSSSNRTAWVALEAALVQTLAGAIAP